MKYFLDCEFLEGKQDKRVLGFKYGETKPTIDLISIALVAEDRREYYAISKDFNLKEAWNRYEWKANPPSNLIYDPAWNPMKKDYWIRDNVLKPIFDVWIEINNKANSLIGLGKMDRSFTYKNFKYFLDEYGKSNAQIAEEVKEFVFERNSGMTPDDYVKMRLSNPLAHSEYDSGPNTISVDYPTFYAYYSAYDHVCLCWLFGRMIDLPKEFPMCTRDLKQMLDEKVYSLPFTNRTVVDKYIREGSYFKERLEDIKNNHPDYPKQTDEHNALSDARWNYELYKFIQTL